MQIDWLWWGPSPPTRQIKKCNHNYKVQGEGEREDAFAVSLQLPVFPPKTAGIRIRQTQLKSLLLKVQSLFHLLQSKSELHVQYMIHLVLSRKTIVKSLFFLLQDSSLLEIRGKSKSPPFIFSWVAVSFQMPVIFFSVHLILFSCCLF